MKKFTISLILLIFLMSIFYPTIYATEELLINDQQEKVDLEDTEIEESESSEEIIEENNVVESYEEENEEVEEIQPKEEIKKDLEVNIGTQDYAGEVFIDTPTNNTSYILPDTKTIKLSGWGVSDDENALLKLYVNNVCWRNIERNVDRQDVLMVKSQYAGTTSKAGFNTDVDISAFPEGAHEIRVDMLSRYGKVINSSRVVINVKNKPYTGEVYIDAPTNNTSYILPDTKTIKLSGWAVANDENAVLKLYVNNVCWRNIERNVDRQDVLKAKSQYSSTTKKAGFGTDVDISAFPEGAHEIRVDMLSRYGKVINSSRVVINVKNKAYTGEVYIDAPTNNTSYILPDKKTIKLSGWAVANDENAVLKLYVNNVCWRNIERNVDRQDVLMVKSEYAGITSKAGYNTDVDISAFPEGAHEIRVDMVSRYGKVIASNKIIINVKQKAYTGELFIDAPNNYTTYKVPATQNIKLSGWGVANDENAVLKLYVNNVCWRNIERNVDRQDVLMAKSQYAGTTSKAGFNTDVDISAFPEGAHEIKVELVSRFGKVLDSKSIIINSSTPDYKGSLFVDSPIQNHKYSSRALEVKGWALSEDKDDCVRIYLNGNYATTAERVSREDVLTVYEGQFGGREANPNPGYYSLVDISKLQEGMHTLKIVNYSKYGKEIMSTEVRFMISNTKAWGIDVSHYQEDIDWNAVKNQGVTFAILKIGEYRESSGRIIQDSKFERNYAECKRLGILVGGYFYSYAFDPLEASHEAAACLSVISGKSFEMPVFLDIEDNVIINAINNGTTNKANVTNGAITFCNIMIENGHQAGVYASKNFYKTYLYTPLLETYNIWLAHYTGSTDYTGKFDIWQYTSSGSLAGIRGAVDMNWCYRRY